MCIRDRLKHKRNYSTKIHDQKYIKLVACLASHGDLELIPSEMNLYELLDRSDLAIVTPYSSPAYVASSRGTHAVYFDPEKTLVPTFQPAPWVTFASGRAELLRVALDAADHCASFHQP